MLVIDLMCAKVQSYYFFNFYVRPVLFCFLVGPNMSISPRASVTKNSTSEGRVLSQIIPESLNFGPSGIWNLDEAPLVEAEHLMKSIPAVGFCSALEAEGSPREGAKLEGNTEEQQSQSERKQSKCRSERKHIVTICNMSIYGSKP